MRTIAEAERALAFIDEIEALRDALEECLEYFKNREDADCVGDPPRFIPNKEMLLGMMIEDALRKNSWFLQKDIGHDPA